MDFSFLRKEKTLPGLCCLYLLPDKFIVTQTLPGKQAPTVSFAETNSYQPDSLKLALEHIVKKQGLRDATCSWVLYKSDYQLFLLDPPAVSESETASALRWQVKELIDFPAQDAAIEYFTIPSTLSAKKKIYVAAAKTIRLQAVSDVIRDVGLNLQYIDIAELALRNVNALYEDQDYYLGMLAFNDEVEFIITHQKNLLLSRRLPFPNHGRAFALSSEWLNNLISEIQNSFTYCKSQQQRECPTKLLVFTAVPELATQLHSLLNMTIEQLTIEKKLNFEWVMPTHDYLSLDYLIAIGGALRECDHATN